MLMVISPAKTLDLATAPVIRKHSQPQFLDQSQRLIDRLRELSAQDLCALMDISTELGELNAQRNRDWQLPFTPSNAKQALLAFRGDVYEGMQADTFSTEDFAFAQTHLRILSGLYGLLKPLDLMQAYRLEMGTALGNERGANLYQFWGERITDALNEALRKARSEVLVNLASNEYFKAVRPKQLNATVITPQFRDLKNGEYKMISFFAKRARGLMASYITRQQIRDAEAIRGFDVEGYRFNPQLSAGANWVFTRDMPWR